MDLRGGWLGRVTSPIHAGRAGHGERSVGNVDCGPGQLPACWPQQPHLHSPLRPGAAGVWQRGWYPHPATLWKYLHVKVGPQDENLLVLKPLPPRVRLFSLYSRKKQNLDQTYWGFIHSTFLLGIPICPSLIFSLTRALWQRTTLESFQKNQTQAQISVYQQLQRRRLPHSLTIRPLCCPAANCWTAPGSSAFALWGLQLNWTRSSRAVEPWEN